MLSAPDAGRSPPKQPSAPSMASLSASRAGRTLGLVGESGCGKSTTGQAGARPDCTDLGRDALRGRAHAAARHGRLARAAAAPADGLPGSAGRARPTPADRRADRRAARHPCHRHAGRAARARARHHGRGRPAVAPVRPLSARTLGRPAPARRAGARADHRATAAGLRRADLRPRRLDPGAGREPAARSAGPAGRGLSLPSATISGWCAR